MVSLSGIHMHGVHSVHDVLLWPSVSTLCWGAPTWRWDHATLKSINSVAIRQWRIMMGLRKSPGESWESWLRETGRTGRAALLSYDKSLPGDRLAARVATTWHNWTQSDPRTFLHRLFVWRGLHHTWSMLQHERRARRGRPPARWEASMTDAWGPVWFRHDVDHSVLKWLRSLERDASL